MAQGGNLPEHASATLMTSVRVNTLFLLNRLPAQVAGKAYDANVPVLHSLQ